MVPLVSMTAATGGDTSKLQKAAQDFEAMAIGQLLAPMFDTVDTANGIFGGGAGEEAWKPMLIAELGKHIAAHGGFGLAAPVLNAMLRMQESQPVPQMRLPS
jgi:Rod binding domain-containing protein